MLANALVFYDFGFMIQVWLEKTKIGRKMSEHFTPDKAQLEYDFTYSELEREQPTWLALRTRVERTGGLDAKLNKEYGDSSKVMDFLLDELFGRMVKLEALGIRDVAA